VLASHTELKQNKTQNSQFLRAAEAVGLAAPENFKSPSFSKYDVFCTGGLG
jgi:hypothetical protein